MHLLAEDPQSLALGSRYVRESFVLPGYTRSTNATVDFLLGYARQQTQMPVLFPTADTDLLLYSANHQLLSEYFQLILPSPQLVSHLSDKSLFMDFAKHQGLPVPGTFTMDEVAASDDANPMASFPLILKPSHPGIWRESRTSSMLSGKKALRIDSIDELRTIYPLLRELDPNIIAQEFVVGPDENHFDIHIYMDRQSNPVAYFTGQKLRLQPPYAGSGCYVKSHRLPEIAEISIEFLKAMNYTGLANINFKQHSLTGKYYLLEINPRVSQWNILASECGINLPLLAYLEACGEPMEGRRNPAQKTGRYYLSFKRDWIAFREYRKNRDWNWFGYIRSLLRPGIVYQVFARDDLKPIYREVVRVIFGRKKAG
ncbi:MAG: ATP-grasp domain-containing protein [Halieaceae bacterium]|nr:ATP-grasp domain-containing protein [Halieaceae bacterium]